MRRVNAIVAICWLVGGILAAQPLLTTVAGGGPTGVEAANTRFHFFYGLATDPAGNIYVTETPSGYKDASVNDVLGCRVYKIDALGKVTIVAGSGYRMYGGDGKTASAAGLVMPTGVATDLYGNVFIADPGSLRVRKVDAVTGLISTVAGDGKPGQAENVRAAESPVGNPFDVAVDNLGNLYLSFPTGHTIRRVDGATGMIRTIAGTGVAGYSGDNRSAVSAQLNEPDGLALDGRGNLYIAETAGGRVRKLVLSTGVLSTAASVGGLPGYSLPAAPMRIAVNRSGNLAVSCQSNQVVSIDTATGRVSVMKGLRNPFLPESTVDPFTLQHTSPMGVAFALDGSVLAALTASLVLRADAASGLITTIAGKSQPTGFPVSGDHALQSRIPGITAFAVKGKERLWYAVSNVIYEVDLATGVQKHVFGDPTATTLKFTNGMPATQASFYYKPCSIAADSTGLNLYIRDEEAIRRLDTRTGRLYHFWGNGTTRYTGEGRGPSSTALLPGGCSLFMDAADNLYAGSTGRIQRYTKKTGLVTTIAGGHPGGEGDGGLATAAGIGTPSDITLDSAGNLFYADANLCRVRGIAAATGVIYHLAGSGDCSRGGPDGIDARLSPLANVGFLARGPRNELYMSEGPTGRIRIVDLSTMIISTLAGTGQPGFSADGTVTRSTQFLYPTQIVSDGAGTLHFSEIIRIRRIAVPQPALSAVTLAASGVPGGLPAEATITLAAPAPSGSFIDVSTSNANLTSVPSVLAILEGASTARFQIATKGVAVNTPVTISVRSGTTTKTATLTLNPIAVKSVKITANPIKGGTPAVGSLSLTLPALSNGAIVRIRSSYQSVFAVPSEVRMTAGQTQVEFPATTKAVSKPTVVTVTATYGNVTVTDTVTVSP